MLSELVGELVAARDRAGLFFDIDGVLAPIADRPELARVPAPVCRALDTLVGGYRVVAAVSGRSIDDAVGMLGLDGIVVVGDHGRETRDAQGAIRRVAPADRLLLERAAAALAADETLARLGVRIELKRASLALHVRGAPDEPAALEAAAAAAAVAAGLGLVHHRGRAVVDLKLPGVDKGTAVVGLVEQYGLEAALYVGDDRTDVDAMRALRAFRRPMALPLHAPFEPPRATVPVRSAEQGFMLSPLILLGVRSDEMPRELAEAADHLLPLERVLPLLEALRPPVRG